MTRWKARNRWQAFGIHLGLSFLLFLVLAAIIKFLWYPGVLFSTEGGWQGMRLIAGVDLVIGPLLTLLVYNLAKPELRRDLAIIGLLQIACIIGGMFVVADNRPIAITYTQGNFQTLGRQRFEDHGIDLNSPPLLQGRKPVWLYVALPEDRRERLALTRQSARRGGLELNTELYHPYTQALPHMPHQGLSLDEARSAGWHIPESLNRASTRVYDLQTRYDIYKVAVDTTTGNIIEKLKNNN